MFVSLNQFYIFIASISFGIIGGVLYCPINFIKKKLKKFQILFLLDILYFFVLSVLFLFYSFLLKFPNVRAYMIFGVFLGIILYIKSFNNILAKVIKRVYNIISKNFAIRKNKDDRRKG